MPARLATFRPLAISAAARKSSMRELVQEPINTLSIATSVSGMPGFSPIGQRFFCRRAFNRIGKRSRIGNIVVHGNHLAWIGAPGDLRWYFFCLQSDNGIETGVFVGLQGFPAATASSLSFAFRRMQTAFDIVKGGFVRCDRLLRPFRLPYCTGSYDLPAAPNYELLRRKTPPHARCRLRCQFYR